MVITHSKATGIYESRYKVSTFSSKKVTASEAQYLLVLFSNDVGVTSMVAIIPPVSDPAMTSYSSVMATFYISLGSMHSFSFAILYASFSIKHTNYAVRYPLYIAESNERMYFCGSSYAFTNESAMITKDCRIIYFIFLK